MKLKVEKLVENTSYSKTTIDKILTNCGISNHFVLTMEDLIHLYKNTECKNSKSWTLSLYLEEIIPDEYKEVYI